MNNLRAKNMLVATKDCSQAFGGKKCKEDKKWKFDFSRPSKVDNYGGRVERAGLGYCSTAFDQFQAIEHAKPRETGLDLEILMVPRQIH